MWIRRGQKLLTGSFGIEKAEALLRVDCIQASYRSLLNYSPSGGSDLVSPVKDLKWEVRATSPRANHELILSFPF